MRITAQSASMDMASATNVTKSAPAVTVSSNTTQNTSTTKQTKVASTAKSEVNTVTEATNQKAAEQVEKNDANREKLQQAVDSLNEFIGTDHTASKFVFHEGLDRYFVQVVDSDTEEVVKEIPPRKLLDAFYEMQKLVGMIVDKKI